MEGITRRGFMGAMGAMGMVGALGAAGTALADGAAEPGAYTPGGGSFAEGALEGWNGTPAEIEAMGGCTMPLAELNRRRRAYIDSQTEYVCEDGTVIPASVVKVRAMINSYGLGCGNEARDDSWGYLMEVFSNEEDAEFFVHTPLGVEFNGGDAYAATGRPVEECIETLDRIAAAGLLCRYDTNDGPMYHHVPIGQGIAEYQMDNVAEDPTFKYGIATSLDFSAGGTPCFYAVPCDTSVVSEPTIMPYDDLIELIKGKTRFGIAPCVCRYETLLRQGVEGIPTLDDFHTGAYEDYMSPLNGCRVETCLHMGDEANYWIDHGLAREIDQETALRYVERSRDDGFILHSAYGKISETVCSCSVQGGCNLLMLWSLLGDGQAQSEATTFNQISHYTLDVDYDKCIKCGACAQRCPVQVITMDEESGYPVVAPNCFRCGQCAYICPQSARKLVLRPEEEILEMPRGFIEDANQKAGFRFEHGEVW